MAYQSAPFLGRGRAVPATIVDDRPTEAVWLEICNKIHGMNVFRCNEWSLIVCSLACYLKVFRPTVIMHSNALCMPGTGVTESF